MNSDQVLPSSLTKPRNPKLFSLPLLHFFTLLSSFPSYLSRLCVLITACYMSWRQVVLYESNCHIPYVFSLVDQFLACHWHIPTLECLALYASFFLSFSRVDCVVLGALHLVTTAGVHMFVY